MLCWKLKTRQLSIVELHTTMIADTELAFLDQILEDCGFYELCDCIGVELGEEDEKADTTYSADQIYQIPSSATNSDWFLSYWHQYE